LRKTKIIAADARPGVSQTMALAELRGIQSAINKQSLDNAHGIDLEPLSQYFFGDLHSILYILLAAMGLSD
jgi:hypothetical protein